ncbi:hypothetical protein P0Y43_07735 [Pseudomonas entomophila]|uniref:hypothetical protein n=1 Tax=Pseudomonas entomophila TaxID=312306 RepID=UPI0023D81677|nr:hypothetical protein [Pseudomonas entomophila]MDF0730623.1 hypothetical protein [Pseudomonas entomophila]
MSHKPSTTGFKAALYTVGGALLNFTTVEKESGYSGSPRQRAKGLAADAGAWEGVKNVPTDYLCATDVWDDETMMWFAHTEVDGKPFFNLYYTLDNKGVYTTDRGYLHLSDPEEHLHRYILIDADNGSRLDISKMLKESKTEYKVYLQSAQDSPIKSAQIV